MHIFVCLPSALSISRHRHCTAVKIEKTPFHRMCYTFSPEMLSKLTVASSLTVCFCNMSVYNLLCIMCKTLEALECEA